MILNIDDLLMHCKDHAAASPIIAEDILISSPGISEDESHGLIKAFPTLPNSYVHFIKAYDVKQVAFGDYQISVCDQKDDNFTEEMINWNSLDDTIRYPVRKKHDLIYFGSDGFDEFFVAGTQSDYKEGEILSIDHEWYDEDPIPIKQIAPDYETFLIICANKYQLQLSEDIEDNEFLDELRLRLDALNLPKEYYEYWVGRKN